MMEEKGKYVRHWMQMTDVNLQRWQGLQLIGQSCCTVLKLNGKVFTSHVRC